VGNRKGVALAGAVAGAAILFVAVYAAIRRHIDLHGLNIDPVFYTGVAIALVVAALLCWAAANLIIYRRR
jgi:hypothetical protein